MHSTRNDARWKLVLLFFAALVLVGSKAPDSLSRAQFWAEDGVIFFAQQYGSHVPMVWQSYAGYLHAIPRLVAWLAAFFSPSREPFVYNLMANLLAAGSLAYVAYRFRNFIPIAMTLAIVLFVPVNGEIFGTITNIQWFSQFVVVALCLPRNDDASTGHTEPWALAAVVLTGLTGLTSIFVTAVIIGLALVALLASRLAPSATLTGDLKSYLAHLPKARVGLLGACAVLQAVCLASHSGQVHTEASGLSQYGMWPLIPFVFGKLLPVHIFGFQFLTSTLWLATELLLLALLVAGTSAAGLHRVVLLHIIAVAALLLIAAAALKDAQAMLNFGSSDRYFYFAKFMFWWTAFYVADRYAPEHRLVLIVAFVAILSYVGMLNAQRLQRPALTDLSWHTHADRLRVPGPHTLPINPVPWKFKVTTPGADEAERRGDTRTP